MDQTTAKSPDQARAEVQERLLDLAGVYRSLNRKELAAALRREGSKLAPSNGNPKLDYLVSLAEVLDWPVGDVAEAIWGGGMTQPEPAPGVSFEGFDVEAKEAHRKGDYERMCELAERMSAVASTADDRALAALRQAGGWDGRGRYARQLEAVRGGLQEGPISADLRLLLQVNLANAHYSLGYLFEARALASELIEKLGHNPPASRSSRAARSFAYYVYGNSCRQLVDQQPESTIECAGAAHKALCTSFDLYTALAREFDHDPWRGIANTCRGGIIEAEAALGERTPAAAIAEINDGLAVAFEGDDRLVGDPLESYGWWCIFGCNIAFRHFRGRERRSRMSGFIRRGYEIADRLSNWSMRERLFTMEFIQRQELNELAGFPVEWTIDEENVKVLVGTMGRFPSFRSTGWRILQTATTLGTSRGRKSHVGT